MTVHDTITVVLIHLVTPILGLVAYGWLCQKMKNEKVPSPPFLIYFILFFTLGGWLMVALTLLFWRPSGMMLVGGVYLVFVAPIITGTISIVTRSQKVLSIYHRRAWWLSSAYAIILAVGLTAWLSLGLMFGPKKRPNQSVQPRAKESVSNENTK